ncbi:MAG: hypothetical protein ABIO38_05960 [Luteimonas sp.]
MARLSDPHFFGVMALECAHDARAVRDALQQADAATLADLLGRDLATLVPAARDLDLAVAAVHFDPAEVLRADWPLHARLNDLRLRAPQHAHGPRVIAVGADANGDAPEMFRADPEMREGALRVVPFVLGGDADIVANVSQAFEDNLLDLGMAKADTALHAQDAFGAKIEHARYLTVYDLAAMTGLQYRNQGLERTWELLETVMLTPDVEAWIDALPEPLVRYAGREVRMALFTPNAWRARYASERLGDDTARLERGYDYFEARQRQVASVLQAHGVTVVFVHCDDAAHARSVLQLS